MVDLGVFDTDPIDHPDVAIAVARDVAAGLFERAILACGTGIGVAITANKVPGVRAASVSDPYSAERARKSNNAQVVCLARWWSARAWRPLLVDHWLAAEFLGGPSARKVAKIDTLDERHRRGGRRRRCA